MSEAIRAYQPHRKAPRKLDGLAKNIRIGQTGKYHWHWDPKFLQRSREAGRPDRLAECARRLEIPTLLIRGGMSDLLSEAGAQAFLKCCPSATFVNVDGAGHMVAGDRNDIFNHAVLSFLQRIAMPASQPVIETSPIKSTDCRRNTSHAQ